MPQLIEQTIYEALRECVSNGMDPEQAADSVLHRVSKSVLADFARPLLVNEARRYTRADTRKIEERVEREIQTGADPIQARRALAEEKFYVPGKGYVAYLDATAEDHLERARNMRQQAGALVKDAERHENAARDIVRYGVKCLRQIQNKQKLVKA